MIMSDDKHGILSIIMKKMGPIGSEHESMEEMDKEDGAEQDNEVGKDAAIDEIMEAIEGKDKMKLKHALQALMEICFDEYEKEPHEEAEHEEQE